MITPGLRAAEVEVPCTCGELVQGYLDGEPFLVSCPIDRYSRVAVALDAGSPPPAPSKASRAVAATLAALGHRGSPFFLRVSSPLPASRGFGTSTADVTGAIVATAEALGVPLSAREIAALAVSIEPSDGTMFPGLAAFEHRSGRRVVALAVAPSLPLAILDFGEGVDTLEYNRKLDLGYLRSREPEYRDILAMLRRGLEGGRWDLVGAAATASARLNQHLLPKPELEAAIALAEAHGAVGVCAAHSGGILGVLFAPEEAQSAASLVEDARGRLNGLQESWTARMVGGGAKVLEFSGGLGRDDTARLEDR